MSYTLRDKSQPYRTELWLNGKLVEMEVDTGAAVSLIGHDKFQELFPQLSLTKSTEILRTYTGERLDVRGEVQVEACYREQKKSLPLIVIDGSGPVLLGRNWLEHIRLDWGTLGVAAIHHTAADTLAPILDRYAIVFNEDLGCITPYKANLQLHLMLGRSFTKPGQCPMLSGKP